jgi:hypothetical protein
MRNIAVKMLIFFLLTSFSVVLLVSCTHTNNLTGKWREAGKKSTIEFHKDGTFNAVDDMGMAVSGKYTIQKNGIIRFEIIHKGSAPEIIDGKLNVHEDELTFNSPDEKNVETYKRAK